MEFEAIVVKLLDQVKGTSARGEWTKQEVILEQPGEFNRKVCVSFWGDKAQDAAALKEGERVSVAVNLESREFNGRWYTEVRAWKLTRAAAQPAAAAMPPMEDFSPSSDTTLSSGVGSGEEFDDLPF